jgi:hypothetical protein
MGPCLIAPESSFMRNFGTRPTITKVNNTSFALRGSPFLGDIVYDSEYHGNAIGSSVPTISGNDKFGYGWLGSGDGPNSFSAFKRDSSGLLEVNTSFSEVDPTPRPEDGPFYPIIMAADANGHLAVLMLEWFAGTIPPPQLASYTVTTQPAP